MEVSIHNVTLISALQLAMALPQTSKGQHLAQYHSYGPQSTSLIYHYLLYVQATYGPKFTHTSSDRHFARKSVYGLTWLLKVALESLPFKTSWCSSSYCVSLDHIYSLSL